GSAVGAYLAGSRLCRGLVFQSGFTSVPDTAALVFPYLPVRLFCRTKMNSLARIARCRCPVLVLHSEMDEHIPFVHARRIYERAPEPKKLVRLAGFHDSRDWQLVAEVRAAWLELLAGRTDGWSRAEATGPAGVMRGEVRHQAVSATGFLSEAEGMRLFELAAEASQHAPCLEVGSYCGKSTLFLAEGCRVSGRYPLFAVDHHRGSEEQQPGQSYFDPDLFDADEGVLDTLGPFMRNIRRAGLTQWVVPVVADSRRLSRYWPQAKLSLVFIDGGHSEDDAFADYHGWSPHVIAGGYLCIHDVFADATQGGRAPYHVLQDARASGLWEDVGQVETLAVLKRRDAPDAETPHHTSRAAAIPLRSARHLGTFPRVRTDAWVMIGQDGGQSIELGDDTLFVFSDTLIAPLRNSHLGRYATRAVPTQPNRQGIFLANSAGVASPTNLRHALAELRYYTDDNGLPREIVRPTKAEREAGIRFWPEH